MRILNPTFELVYFALGLDIANQWRVLQGLQKNATWDAMAGQFARLFIDPQTQPSAPAYSNNYECACLYVDSSACPAGRYGNKDQCGPRQSHPMALAILGEIGGEYFLCSIEIDVPFTKGMINGRRWGDKYGVDLAVLNNTVAGVLNTWDWGDPGRGTNVWGWDFPLLALSQARMNWSPDAVVQTLLKDVLKNLYLPNGINFQGGGEEKGGGGELTPVLKSSLSQACRPIFLAMAPCCKLWPRWRPAFRATALMASASTCPALASPPSGALGRRALWRI
jgi:hypothetical protein